ncbi:MAG: chromosome partitioning protein [Treponema sp.]|nr:chromosome partitioning protein [Treponema sp.]
MNASTAKEYIHGLITSLKLTEKDISRLEADEKKWRDRAELARNKGEASLSLEAEKEANQVSNRLDKLREEEHSIQAEIKTIRSQLPGIAARERSIDNDLLEQQLLLSLWNSEEEAMSSRAFQKLEKEKTAEEELNALKAKMKERENKS